MDRDAMNQSQVVRYAISDLRGNPLATLLNVVAVTVSAAYIFMFGWYALVIFQYQRRMLNQELPTRIVATVTDATNAQARFCSVRLDQWSNHRDVAFAFGYLELNVRVWAGTERAADVFAQATVSGDPASASPRLRQGQPIMQWRREAIMSTSLLRTLDVDPDQQSQSALTLEVTRTWNGHEQRYRQPLFISGVIEDSKPRLLLDLSLLQQLDSWCMGGSKTDPSPAADSFLRAAFYARDLKAAARLVATLEREGYFVEHQMAQQGSLVRLSRVLALMLACFVGGAVINGAICVTVSTALRYQSKKHEIGVLRAMGLSTPNLLGIFAAQGVCIGAIAFCVAVPTVVLLEPILRAVTIRTLSIPFPDAMANPIQWPIVPLLGVVLMGAILFSLAGVLVTAASTCRLRPVEALRAMEH